jgi:hypothetical protein
MATESLVKYWKKFEGGSQKAKDRMGKVYVKTDVEKTYTFHL